ncbi:MAG TPA: SCO family protein [Mycobacteriales bacterium]|nr:SCO family protein [Mycobacteriales bacterium]
MHRVCARRAASVLVIAVLGLLAACGSSVKPPPSSLGSVVSLKLPDDIANLPLTEANGSTTTLAAYRGKAVMIADFLTLCTDICPLISANTAAMARALAADGESGKVALLEISVDPQRDTAARLAAYQKLYGGPMLDWTLLRATPANTKKLWKFFGVFYGRTKEGKPASIDWWTHKPLTYDVDHQDSLVFLNPAGQQRFIVDAAPQVKTGGGTQPPKSLVQFLNPDGIKALYKPNPVDSWTVGQGLQVFSWLLDHKLAAPA